MMDRARAKQMKVVIGDVKHPYPRPSTYAFVEGTLTLPDHDADLNIVFPGGQKAVLQWRLDTPCLDLCFDRPVEVFNECEDMQPAPANQSRPEHHIGVVQLVIPLKPEFRDGPTVCSGCGWDFIGEPEHIEQAKESGNCPNCGRVLRGQE